MSLRHPLTMMALLVAAIAFAPSSMALTNGTATSAFTAVGSFNGASGVLIDDHWVLSAAHVARDVVPGTLSFSSAIGTAQVDALYFAGTSAYPGDDLVLLHLGTALSSSSLPLLESQVFDTSAAAALGSVTLVSAQNAVPRGTAQASASTAAATYTDASGTVYTTNWLITTGPAHVETGDSGSAAFLGSVTDSAGSVLLGIASADITHPDGSHDSAYVQPGAYRQWIDTTLATTGDTAAWTAPVPEAPGLVMALVGAPVLLRRSRAATGRQPGPRR